MLQQVTRTHQHISAKSADHEIISVSSGKGGVGKTLSVITFAFVAKSLGQKVLIIDGDLGMSNVDIVLNIQPRYNITDAIRGDITLREALVEATHGIFVLSSGTGVRSLQQLSSRDKLFLTTEIKRLHNEFNLILLDTGAGIGSNVIHLNRIATRKLVVTTPEPHAIADAYAFIKTAYSDASIAQPVEVIVNMTASDQEGRLVANRLNTTSRQFLGRNTEYLGSVPFDRKIGDLVLRRNFQSESILRTVAGQAWKSIAIKCLKATEASEMNKVPLQY